MTLQDTEEALEPVSFIPPTIIEPFTPPLSSYSYASPIPKQSGPFIIGIDEAGRGPVLGPMIYALAYVPVNRDDDLSSMGFADSKTLNHMTREILMKDIVSSDFIGYEATIMTPTDISAGMLRPGGSIYNLNAQAHDVTINLIHNVIAKVDVSEIYIDTVGPPVPYEKKLAALFPSTRVTVRSKADSLFPIVSAASIIAKVTRDAIVTLWAKELVNEQEQPLGSGYPSDPNTKAWLAKNTDIVFGFPNIVRFSWETAKTLLVKECAQVLFKTDVLAERNAKGRSRVKGRTKQSTDSMGSMALFVENTLNVNTFPKYGNVFEPMAMYSASAQTFGL